MTISRKQWVSGFERGRFDYGQNTNLSSQVITDSKVLIFLFALAHRLPLCFCCCCLHSGGLDACTFPRSAICRASTEKDAGLYLHLRTHACAGYWGQHGCLQRDECSAPEVATRPRSTARSVSAYIQTAAQDGN